MLSLHILTCNAQSPIYTLAYYVLLQGKATNCMLTMQQGPRVDIWDTSEGKAKPVYAMTGPHTALGGAALWFALGQACLGCYSLTTGMSCRVRILLVCVMPRIMALPL